MSIDSNESQAFQEWKPKANPWLIAFAVMLATFMEILDSSVANVALPHMAGTFSATSEEVLWVVTSYLVANAVILPSAAWFSSFFGRKRFLITCIIIFTCASIMCGLSNSLEMMVIARMIQGAGGGALMPITQAVLMETFPPNKRGLSTAIFGIAVIVAPITGPILGGWITENYSWQWIFFINIPIGILAVILIKAFLEDPPYIKNNVPKKIDYIGFIALIVWLVSLQIVLDKGQQADWFAASWICWLSAISVISMIFFIAWEFKFKDSIIDLKVFFNRNYSIASILTLGVGSILYGTLSILPLFLQNLLGYSAIQSGLAVGPRGLGSLCGMIISGILSDKFDMRIQMFLGFLLLAISNFMLGNLNFEISKVNIILPNILSGFATSLIFVPLTTAAFMTLKKEQMGNASGLLNLTRNLGGGFGTSIVSTSLIRYEQVHQTFLSGGLNPYNHILRNKINALTGFLSLKMTHVTANHGANALVYSSLIKQASLMSYVDSFRLFCLLCLILAPAAFLIKKVKAATAKSESALH